MSLTQWFTRSRPTVSWIPVSNARRSFVPTPSHEATRTGSFRPERSGRNMPPKLPMSARTPFVRVDFTTDLIRASAVSWASMSTPAARYVIRFFMPYSSWGARRDVSKVPVPSREPASPPALLEEAELLRLGPRDLHRVLVRPAGGADLVPDAPDRAQHSLEAQVPEAVRPHEPPDVLDGVARRDQLLAPRRVDPVVARPDRRGARDAEVDLLRARAAAHLDDLLARRPPHDRVVDEDDPLPLEDGPRGVELDADAEVADLLARLDEGAADVVVPDEPHVEGDARRPRVTERREHAGVRNRHDDVRVRRLLPEQLLAEALPHRLDRLPEHDAVRPREVHVLEDAGGGPDRREGLVGVHPAHVADRDLAPRGRPYVLGAQQVERARLARHHPPPVHLPERERAPSVGIPHHDQPPRHEEHERVGPPHLPQGRHDRVHDVVLPGA